MELRPVMGQLSKLRMSWFNIKHWWNNSGMGKPDCSEGNIYQCHAVHRKFNVYCLETEPGFPRHG